MIPFGFRTPLRFANLAPELYTATSLTQGWCKSMFTVVRSQNSLFLYCLLIIVLFSIPTTVDLLLPHPVQL